VNSGVWNFHRQFRPYQAATSRQKHIQGCGGWANTPKLKTQNSKANLLRSDDQRRRKLLRHSDALQIIAAQVIKVRAATVLSGFLLACCGLC
jgi:hypothetical protein